MRVITMGSMLLLLAGCTSLHTGKEIATSTNLDVKASQPVSGTVVLSGSNLDTNSTQSREPEPPPQASFIKAMLQVGISVPATATTGVSVPATATMGVSGGHDGLNSARARSAEGLPVWSRKVMYKALRSFAETGNSILASDIRKANNYQAADKTTFDRSELADFVRSSIRYSGLFDKEGVESQDPTLLEDKDLHNSDGGEDTLRERTKYYLFQYLLGNYVDHLGTSISAPKISNTVGNETIIPFMTVILDAFFDETYGYPILVQAPEKAPSDGPKPAQSKQSGGASSSNANPTASTTPTGTEPKDVGAVAASCTQIVTVFGSKQPTFIAYEQFKYIKAKPKDERRCPDNKELKVVEIKPADGDTGKKFSTVSVGEAGMIRFAGEVGNNGTQALSGFLIRELGGFHVSAVLVGGIGTIGSNDTLSKAIETVASQIAQRNIERDLLQSVTTTCKTSGAALDCGVENTKITKTAKLVGALYEQWKNSQKSK